MNNWNFKQLGLKLAICRSLFKNKNYVWKADHWPDLFKIEFSETPPETLNIPDYVPEIGEKE